MLLHDTKARGLVMTDKSSAIPYVLASAFLGWEVVLPIYFALYIVLSGEQGFYYPIPRAINPSITKTLPRVLLVSYIPLAIRAATNLMRKPEVDFISGRWDLSLAHLSLPILIHAGKDFFKSASAGLTIRHLQFETRDVKDLSRFFTLIFLFTSTAHLALISQILPQIMLHSTTGVSEPEFSLSSQWLQIGSLTLAIVVWCIFTIWDMRRVNLTKTSLLVTLLGAVTGSVAVGPAAVLSALWWWREAPLESGRQRE